MRRDKGEGNIRQRPDGRWEARVTAPNGSRRSIYGSTRTEVAKLLKKLLGDIDDGLLVGTNKQTVGDFLTSWLAGMDGQVRPSSLRRYGDYINGHLIPTVGHIELGKLTAQHIQAAYADRRWAGLSNTSIQCMHRLLHQALDHAVRMRVLSRNVADDIKAPRRDTPAMSVLSAEQARAFLGAARSYGRYYGLFVLALSTGMRQGELLALCWEDVDLEHREIHVRRSVQESGSGYIIGEPKTAGSKRTVAISDYAAEVLREQMAWHWFSPLGLVFPSTAGTIKRPEELRDIFKAIIRASGVPDVRFHDLRHTAATLMIASGVNVKVVSEMLGHASVEMTLRIYTHVTPHMQRAAQDTMNRLLQAPEGGE